MKTEQIKALWGAIRKGQNTLIGRTILAFIVAFIVVLPVLGVQLRQEIDGLKFSGQLSHAVYAGLVVALIVFSQPLLNKMKRFSGAFSGWRFSPAQYLEQQRAWVLALLIIIGLTLPFYAGRTIISVATLALVYVMLGLSLNIVVGYAGLLNLGHAGFYAIGAYTYAILQQHGWGFWLSLPVAGVMAGAFGILLGFPILRLRGDYLAIVTLGFGEIIGLLIRNLPQLTGGPNGISSIQSPTFFNLVFTRKAPEGYTPFHEWAGIAFKSEYRLIYNYLIILALCLFTLWLINRLLRMPIGRAWEALREDEIACRSLGINPTVVKLSAFALSALFAGVAGAFFASSLGSITPDSFTFWESALILAIVVLGGMGSQVGVILSAIALTVLPELAREFSEYRMLIFGAVMVLMMLWRPQGLIPAQRPKMELPE